MKKLQQHEVRVCQEHLELADKVSKLENFVNGDVFSNLHDMDRQLLLGQLHAMTEYLTILAARIARFNSENY